MSYLNEHLKSRFIDEQMTALRSFGHAPPTPRPEKEEQLGPACEAEPSLLWDLSFPHSHCCFGTCSCQHMLPPSVRCPRTAAK